MISRFALRSFSTLQKYEERVAQGLLKRDEKQFVLAQKLDKLEDLVSQYHQKRLEWSKTTIPDDAGNKESQATVQIGAPEAPRLRIPRGLYIHGDVGTGKTMLMDLFFDSLKVPKKRVHLHSFLQQIHQDIHSNLKRQQTKRGARYAVEELGRQLANNFRVIAFDEFFISDAAEAAILHALLESMLMNGLVLVATSNVEPRELHESFQDYLPKFLVHCKVHDIDGVVDYRESNGNSFELTTQNGHLVTSDAANAWRDDFLANASPLIEDVRVDCGFEMSVNVPFAWHEKDAFVGSASFEWLCGSKGKALGSNEYYGVCSKFDKFVISGVPQIRVQPGKIGDQSRRFCNFIDIAYDLKLAVTTISEFEDIFVIDPLNDSEEIQSPETEASIRSFLRARSRWRELSRGSTG